MAFNGRNIILYHDNCMDGFVAGMIAHTKAIYDGLSNIVMVPVNYNEVEFHAERGDNVVMVDFCLEPEHIALLRLQGVHVTVVDHHETQIAALALANFGEYGSQADHNISYTCDCHERNSHFFSKLLLEQPESNRIRGDYRAFLSDNRDQSPQRKECGASMSFALAGKDEDFYKFMLTYLTVKRPGTGLNYELNRTIDLVRTHDLWLHDGKPDHDANYLALWFKHFYRQQKEQVKLMKERPSLSFKIFAQIKALWLLTPLVEKLEFGEQLANRMIAESRLMCASAFEVQVNSPEWRQNPDVRVGFIPGDFKTANISMTGSILVKEYCYDVAVMFAINNAEDSTVTLSWRTDQYGKNIDAGGFCAELVKNGHAIKGGGHRNAAGCTLTRAKFEEIFKVPFN